MWFHPSPFVSVYSLRLWSIKSDAEKTIARKKEPVRPLGRAHRAAATFHDKCANPGTGVSRLSRLTAATPFVRKRCRNTTIEQEGVRWFDECSKHTRDQIVPRKTSKRDKTKELFWRKAIARQSESGLSQQAFCQKEGLNPNNFSWWKRKISRREGTPLI